MRPALLASAASLALIAPSAMAAQAEVSITLTNNTADSWLGVVFELRPPIGQVFDIAEFATVKFDSGLGVHSVDRPVQNIFIPDAPDNKRVTFLFAEAGAITPGDFPVTFTVRVDNPPNMDFRIGYFTIAVPSPGAVAALALPGIALAARRRR